MNKNPFAVLHTGEAIPRAQIPLSSWEEFRSTIVNSVTAAQRIAAFFADSGPASDKVDLYAILSDSARALLRAQRPVIESKQEISLFDLLSFLEMNLGNLSINARLDHPGCDRLDAADRGDPDRRRHLDGDSRHDGLTRRRPRRSGICSFVEDKPSKIVP